MDLRYQFDTALTTDSVIGESQVGKLYLVNIRKIYQIDVGAL